MAINNTIQKVIDTLTQIEPQIVEAEQVISFMKSAGENTMEQESKLRELKRKVDSYRQALSAQGYVK